MEKRKYDNDFKRMIVELSNTGKTAKELGTAYGLNSGIIRRWKREYKAKQGDFSKKNELTPEELELKSLKKELRDVRMERDILKKAVSIFSKSDQ